MINIASLQDNLEVQLDIEELQDFGLSDEEILGYLEFFCDSLVRADKIETKN